MKFDISVFEGDSARFWLACSQRVVYQAKACGFETEMAAAEGEELSVGADDFDRSYVDPVGLRNAHAGWMTLISSCRGMAPENVQRSGAPNDAW